VNKIVRRAAERAGVKSPDPTKKGVNPHLLRHSFGRHWLDAGGDLRALSYMLGHSSVAVTADVYGSPSQEFIRGQYDRFVHRSP
jgi:site-specific recombinase XerD